MSKDLTQYVTTKEAGEMFGIDTSMLRRLLIDGRIQGKKLGHDWLVFLPSLKKYDETKSARGRPRLGTPQPELQK